MRVLLLAAVFGVTACRTVTPAWSIERALDETRRTTTEGEVLGGAGKNGGYAWLGIPFAAPPVNEGRWRAPLPPAHRDAPLVATRVGHACVQPDNPLTINEAPHDGVLGEEDCLWLSVFAPLQAQGLPVMVWVHGGGNSIGSAASYELSRFATTQNAVMVAVQYRLGPFGWLRDASLADERDASGNFGTLDLVRALEWVRDNAAAFGGDPSRVTVFGESAGGTDTYAMLLSPRAKGLFHRAIAQSAAFSRTSLEEGERTHPNSSHAVLLRVFKARGAADDAAAEAKLQAMKPAEVAALWRSLPVGEVIRHYRDGAKGTADMLAFPALFPDGDVLPKAGWLEAFATPGGWNRVPVITGSNRDEAKLFQFIDPKWTWRLFGILPRIRGDAAQYERTAQSVSRLWRALSVDSVATAMRASGADDVWSYRFDWDEEPTLLGTDLSQMLGAAHGVEVSFVHGNFDGPLGRFLGGEVNPRRDALSAAMMGHWATFAREGHPAPGWERYDVSSDEALRYLTFDTPVEAVKMTAGVEKTDALIDALLADASMPLPDKCEGLHRLVGIGFVSAERAAQYTACAPSP
ncbi:MAG: carboxylesterase family protein [Archangiaceae bacterium]|nr:carboxylesterase family protein [Archangiaceae bacterium]